jgi:hypothetical protein
MAPNTTRLLDHTQLDRFAEALRRSAPPVAASMGPGISEDEIRTVCAQASLEPSRDAITWFSYWDTLAEPRTKFVEVLPHIQTTSLRTCVRSTVQMRRVYEQVLATPPPTTLSVAHAWPNAWLSVFGDGGGTQFVLDCREPDRPSLLRDCFRESFAGDDWGKPIAPLAVWLANGTEWMATQSCRFDPAREQWLPFDAASAYWPHFDMTKPANPPIPGSPDQD